MNTDLNLEISDKLLYTMFNRSIIAILDTIIRLSISDFSSSKDIVRILLKKMSKDNELNYLKKEKLYIPQFIVASLNNNCNFESVDSPYKYKYIEELTSEQWGNIFRQAYDLGVSFIILSGGEPLLKKEVLLECSKYPKTVFPIFTDINLITTNWVKFFNENRNIIPIININSLEKLKNTQIYKIDIIEKIFCLEKILFGISITVTKDNFDTVLSEEYIMKYKNRGCITIIFRKYNYTSNVDLNLTKEQELEFSKRISKLRLKFKWVFSTSKDTSNYLDEDIEFNKGIIHISSHGVIKECEYSIYADMNLQYTTLETALNSLSPLEYNEVDDLIEDEFNITKLLEEEDSDIIIEKNKKGLIMIKSIKNDKT